MKLNGSSTSAKGRYTKIRSSTRKPPPRTWPPPGANCALPRTLPAPAAAGECLICTRRGHPRSRYACTTLSSPPAGHFVFFRAVMSHIIMISTWGCQRGYTPYSCQTVTFFWPGTPEFCSSNGSGERSSGALRLADWLCRRCGPPSVRRCRSTPSCTAVHADERVRCASASD